MAVKRGSRQSGFAVESKRVFESPLDKAKGYEVVWPQTCDLFDAARGIRDATFIYVIGEHEDGGPVKIGVAKDPIKRLRSMQTGNPRRLRVEYVLLGDMHTEKLLHEFWEPFAITSAGARGKVDAPPGTEWFQPKVREKLFPIVETAAKNQVERLLESEGLIRSESMERIIRDAHKEHDFIAKGRDEMRFLAAGAGYIIPRPSRI